MSNVIVFYLKSPGNPLNPWGVGMGLWLVVCGWCGWGEGWKEGVRGGRRGGGGGGVAIMCDVNKQSSDQLLQ